MAAYLKQTGLRATKLHFPGAMRTEDSIEYAQVLETLEAVRDAVGPDKILAEFPMGEDLPKEFMSGAWLLAPDWPGIYRIPAASG